MSKQSAIHKSSVLITNGASPLSQALCEQLIETYKCQVAFLYSAEDLGDVTLRSHESLSLFDCDLTNRQQLSEIAAILEAKFGKIDLIVHLESDIGEEFRLADQCVRRTSKDILGYVNLLTCFIPSMLGQGRGRIVSIKHTENSAKAAIESQPDYDDLVQSIFYSQAASAPKLSLRQLEDIRFTTILSNHPYKRQVQHAKHTPFLNLTVHEVAQRILEGIESEQLYVHIQARRSLLEFCSTNIAQLASIGLDILQLRKSQKFQLKVQ